MSGLAGARVLELPGDDAVSYCGWLLAEAGADVVLLESETVAENARRRVLHAGKRSVSADADLELRLTDRAELVLRPAVGERDPWTVALRGTALAFTATARLLGLDETAASALDNTLEDGTLFPLPQHDPTPVREGQRMLRALDGWVVAGPSSLPADSLSALVHADGARTLEEWVGARRRDEACEILQQWRTTFVPVLDPREADAIAPGACLEARPPFPGQHTDIVVREWLVAPSVAS